MDCTTWIFWLPGFQGLGDTSRSSEGRGREQFQENISIHKKEMRSFVTLQGAEEQLSTHVGDLSFLLI